MTDFTPEQLSHDERKWKAFLVLVRCVREFVEADSVEERTAWEQAVVVPTTMIFHKDHISNYNLRQALRLNGFSNSNGLNTLWHRDRPRLSGQELNVVISALEVRRQTMLQTNSIFALVTEKGPLTGPEVSMFLEMFETCHLGAQRVKALRDAIAEAKGPLTEQELKQYGF